MAIYVTGDTHGYYQQLMDRIMGNGLTLTKDDILLVAGDFGFVWNVAENIEAFKQLALEPFTVAFVDGNHEEFPLINSFPVTEWNGGKVHRIGTSENIIHLMRGQCFTIEGKTFF
ncbi:MAG: metallophosphoesterase, partial [Oscillospiraceae bacterium]|nr:metallophosphoesterase [Oscillospiraceae bacterium]